MSCSGNSLPYDGHYPMGKGKAGQATTDAACKAGWYRFTEVDKFVPSGHSLYRASCPGYKTSDADQKLTTAHVDFLSSQKIDSILSFNEHSYTPSEISTLTSKKISYKHIEVKDFGVASDKDYETAWKFFKDHKSTLVHCGFGWGRTGTAICALQLFSTKGASPDEKLWGEVDGGDQVEKPEQIKALKGIRDALKKGSIKP